MTFLENLEWRSAVKRFNGEKVSDENLNKILNSIRMAPSSQGLQPYHVVIISKKEVLDELKKFAKGNEPKFETCSHMLVFCQRYDVVHRTMDWAEMLPSDVSLAARKLIFKNKSSFARNILFMLFKKGEWTRAQTYLALGFALSACCELKVDSCPMEGFEAEQFRRILNLPKDIFPSALLAIGYRDENEKPFPKIRFSENDLFTKI